MGTFSFGAKHVLLTGAAGGLGVALARELAARGAHLALSDRSLEALETLKAELAGGGTVIALPADLASAGAAEHLADEALAALGHIDVVINNAGIGYHALMEETALARVRWVYEVNAFAPLALTKALLPSMKRKGAGRIINILSCAGFIHAPTTGIYGASKAAFAAMARVLRFELEPSGIKVYNFYPGPMATAFNENALRENQRPGVHACGSVGTPAEQIAVKILFAAGGRPRDIWLDRRSKWLALTAMLWPKATDRRLVPLRQEVLAHRAGIKPLARRRWRLWQLETSIACNLDCIMCPWKTARHLNQKTGDMAPEVWDALRAHLPETQSVDFSGGGEPLLQPRLVEWIREAAAAGCRTGFLTNGQILNRRKIVDFIRAGLDWIGFSVDGATADSYEHIRRGADFNRLCDNIAAVAALRDGKRPFLLINFVLMPENSHEVDAIVSLAGRLGVDQVNFKQCDVIRGDHGRGHGLFASKETRAIRRLKSALAKARRRAAKLGVKTTAFAFVPDELPVCDQDPRSSLFVRHDGRVAPCINLANGGPSVFLGEDVEMPTVHYGRLPDRDLADLWETQTCRFYRDRFEQRSRAHDAVIAGSNFEASLIKLQEVLASARQAMPAAPDGCRVCHYLYDI